MVRRQKRMLFLAGGMTVLAIAAFLVFRAFQDNVLYFFSPTQLVEKQVPAGQRVRIGGLVEEGSIDKLDGLNVSFGITDMEQTVVTHYRGVLPDLFRECQGVVVEGAMREDGTFEATQVLAKHDENYMPAEVADALEGKIELTEEGGMAVAHCGEQAMVTQ